MKYCTEEKRLYRTTAAMKTYWCSLKRKSNKSNIWNRRQLEERRRKSKKINYNVVSKSCQQLRTVVRPRRWASPTFKEVKKHLDLQSRPRSPQAKPPKNGVILN
ncbi:hypothetical protein AOXY_G27816 [Acipenser oxyrinchus oxyrinchus]|uniref:Uncharacterized protein n=1 Tax=Acipenser oxyrinchus oxyrinchus TaxID=40147 RepID=A0AAD8CSU3_ACIOX|nr:hypothetical protein AOXY_G27816 [Acipenser oxyrinchus oxyrinchus]